MRSDQDCRNFYAVAYEMLMKLQTVHLRHLEIDNQAVGNTGSATPREIPVPIRKSGHEKRANAATGSRP